MRVRLAIVVTAGLLGMWLGTPAREHIRAAMLLRHLRAPAANIRTEPTTIGSANARYYWPAGDAPPAGLVLVHGIHHLGIEEPRLVAFANALAQSGIVVLTPQLDALADYHVAPDSIATIGAAILQLRQRLGVKTVGVMGLSFGGGLSLLAAADPRYASAVRYAVAIGAHDDLRRVANFFATNDEPCPDGVARSTKAHDYGAAVLAYSHVSDFFPATDATAAKVALQKWLHEDQAGARAATTAMSEPARATLAHIFAAESAALRPALSRMIVRENAEMDRVSPHGQLAGLRAPTFLLHGAADTVIPPCETLWLAKDVPPFALRSALVTNTIGHVELSDKPSVIDKWQLIHFVAGFLGEAGTDTRRDLEIRLADKVRSQSDSNVADHIVKNVEAVGAVYERAEHDAGRHQRSIERVTNFLGRPRFLYSVLAFVVLWVAGNLIAVACHARAIDPPPFFWLQGLISTSALLTTISVLITQNRQGRLGDHRAHIDLQVNLLAEKKIAKIIALIEELRRDLPSVRNRFDAEAKAMETPADPKIVAEAIEGGLRGEPAPSLTPKTVSVLGCRRVRHRHRSASYKSVRHARSFARRFLCDS